MRILYAAFAFIVLVVSLLLILHSAWLFAAFLGAFPVALVLLWIVRIRHNVETENVSPEQDILSVPWDPKETQSIRKSFWMKVAIVLLSPICAFVILRFAQRFAQLPKFVEPALIVLILVIGILFLHGLWSVTRILLVERSETHFPKWSLLAGVASAAILGVCILGPFLLIRSCGPRPSALARRGPPPGAFKIDQTVSFSIESGEPEIVTERYDIEPRMHYTVTDIEEVNHGFIPQIQIHSLESFESGKVEDMPVEGMHLTLHRPFTSIKKANIGLLRSKITFSLPKIALLTRDLKRNSSLYEPLHGEVLEGWFPVARASEFNSTVRIELPKNSFLAASPKGEFNSLPDKDFVSFSFSKFPDEVEVYYLRRARFKVVKDLLSQSSNHDVIVSIVAFLFWPATMLVAGVFHKRLADSTLSFFGKLLRRKPAKPIGFRPPTPK